MTVWVLDSLYMYKGNLYIFSRSNHKLQQIQPYQVCMHPTTFGYYESNVNVMATQPTPPPTYSPMVSLLYNKALLKPLFLRGGTLGRVSWSTESFSSPILQGTHFSQTSRWHQTLQGLGTDMTFVKAECCHFLEARESRCVPVYAHWVPSASWFWSGLEPKHWASQGIWSTGGSQQSSDFSISILEHPEIWS